MDGGYLVGITPVIKVFSLNSSSTEKTHRSKADIYKKTYVYMFSVIPDIWQENT